MRATTFDSSAPILHALKWDSLADRRAKQLKSLMFKTVNNLVPEYLSDKFASINTIHRHNLRGAQHNLFIPRPNTEALKKSFRYRGAVTWNSLLVEAKQTTTSIVFIPLLYIKIFLVGIYYRIFSIMFVIF